MLLCLAKMASFSPPSTFSSSPPWEVLLLISQHLDPKTLAIASCVCKTWCLAMSQDQLWKPLCLSQYPSLTSLRLFDPNLPYHLLFSLGHRASRLRRPPLVLQPQISLQDLIFVVDVFSDDEKHVLSIARSGEDLDNGPTGVFRFEISFGDDADGGRMEEEGGVKVAWSVVSRRCKGAFFLMDGRGKGKRKSIGSNASWFSEELPLPGCCLGMVMSGLVAEIGLEFKECDDGRRMRVERVNMGLVSVVKWRYLSVDDGLRYLQNFLLP